MADKPKTDETTPAPDEKTPIRRPDSMNPHIVPNAAEKEE